MFAKCSNPPSSASIGNAANLGHDLAAHSEVCWLLDASTPPDRKLRAVAGGSAGGSQQSQVRSCSPEVLVDLAFDTHAAVARAAALRAVVFGTQFGVDGRESGRLARLLKASPHARVRVLANLAREPVSGDRIFQTDPADPFGRWQAQRRLRRDPAACVLELRNALCGANETAATAIRWIATLGLADRFQSDLIRLAADGSEIAAVDQRLRATACRVLGSVPGPISLGALQARLTDPDARVRSNALEGLASPGSVHVGTPEARQAVNRLKQDSHHRPRSTAALLAFSLPGSVVAYRTAALRDLHELLAPEHSEQELVAGLWAVGAVVDSGAVPANEAFNTLAPGVQRLLTLPAQARLEHASRVRLESRARTVLTRLEAAVRLGWQASKPAAAGENGWD